MNEREETPPFAQRLERLLNARYANAERSEMRDYILDPTRLEEARGMEQYVWAFRVSETLKQEGPDVGIGRIDGAQPARLAECLNPPRFSKWGMAEMLVAAELNDLLIAYGYDLGIGAEAEVAAELRLGEMDDAAAWETIVALCHASIPTLTSWFDMAPDLLPFVHDMAARNVKNVAAHQGLRVRPRLPRDGSAAGQCWAAHACRAAGHRAAAMGGDSGRPSCSRSHALAIAHALGRHLVTPPERLSSWAQTAIRC